MSFDREGPERLTEQHLRLAYELGADHAEDGRSRVADADALWVLVMYRPREAFEEDAPVILLRSYASGHLDFF